MCLPPAFLSQKSGDIRVRSLDGNSFTDKLGDHGSWFAGTAIPVSTCCPRVIANNIPFQKQDHPGMDNKLYGYPAEKETGRDAVTALSEAVVVLRSPDVLCSSC